MAQVLGTMWFRWALKSTIHRTHLNQGQAKLCLLVSSKHLWCPKNILEETGLQGPKPMWAPPASPWPGSPSLVSARHKPFIHISPAQPVLPLWLVLCLCWCSVPTFKGNNYISISPSVSKHSHRKCEIKLCLYGLTLLHLMVLLKSDLPCPESLVSNTNVSPSENIIIMEKNKQNILKLTEVWFQLRVSP